MRKLVFVVSILLVVVALAGPWLVGQQIEKITRASQPEIAASLPPWAELVEADFQRGWFGSASRYRIVLTEDAPPAVRQLIGNYAGFGDQPALIVNNAIQHGPLVGLLTPAAAEIDSGFAVDNGSGELSTLPLVTETRIGLTGSLGAKWWMGALSLQQPQGNLTAGESSGALRVSGDQRHIELDVAADALTVTRLGQTALSLQSVSVENVLDLGAEVTRLDADYAYIDGADAVASSAVSGEIAISGIATNALPGAIALLGKIQQEKPNDAQLQSLLEASLPTLIGLLAESPVIEWQQINQQAAGDILSDFTMTLAPQSGPVTFQPFVDQLVADALISVDFSAPIETVESGTSGIPMLTNALALGMLEKDRDAGIYRMDLDYSGGEATVNGLPLPLGMQQ